jgi:hypothetical protein
MVSTGLFTSKKIEANMNTLECNVCGSQTQSNNHDTIGAKCNCYREDGPCNGNYQILGFSVAKVNKEDSTLTKVQKLIVAECNAVRDLLLAKNREYGNSALEPIRVFCDLPADEQIKVRIDDKLSRLKATRGRETKIVEDTVQDLIGYLVLLRVAGKIRGKRA